MGPLEGIKVIDFTQAYSGNFCTMHLADYGAEVIKIERYSSGDQAREWAPIKNGHSAYFATVCRGKKSLEINLKSDEGKEVIKQLVKDADIVTENFKVGSLDRLGLGYDVLKGINSRIIYASISGFGLNGPMSKFPAYDNVASAASGIMYTSGFEGGPPLKTGPALGDSYPGASLFMGICMALFHREKTGEGQRIDVSMFDSLFSLLDFPILEYATTGNIPKRYGNSDPGCAPYDIFEAKDGFISLGIASDRLWLQFCNVLDKQEWIENAKFKTNENRVANYQELKLQIEEITRSYRKEEFQNLLISKGIPCIAVSTVPEMMENPQIVARNMVVDIDDPGVGIMKAPGIPIKFSATPGIIKSGAPLLGSSTVEVLESIGYSDDEIKQMRSSGVINYL
ncbi:CoA transferase [Sporosarcina sp. P13]|uniref:CaiB/BaiF CoA transferase family protein n=1 Tax=Sporosarcina sp. P13 TaxID=2048263 RepID=UPI000C165A3E|nr:CaiB/BaiF CoA-transferase family protein [Sporosarcina sp. P13]PIC63473.1 CoA transferase [Sporosarcina sp. P13]